jgi:hypothetical protein
MHLAEIGGITDDTTNIMASLISHKGNIIAHHLPPIRMDVHIKAWRVVLSAAYWVMSWVMAIL